MVAVWNQPWGIWCSQEWLWARRPSKTIRAKVCTAAWSRARRPSKTTRIPRPGYGRGGHLKPAGYIMRRGEVTGTKASKTIPALHVHQFTCLFPARAYVRPTVHCIAYRSSCVAVVRRSRTGLESSGRVTQRMLPHVVLRKRKWRGRDPCYDLVLLGPGDR